ncbi:MAG: trypsin-like peptidase domain-containing protein, partial [Ruminococcus sp.]|nr:trypsin-like peptidase domain-containing protein [Ruminococcus sp.]
SDDSSEVSNTITKVVENAMPSMVSISTVSEEEVSEMYSYFYRFFDEDFDNAYEVQASGSGFIISQNSDELLIATNNHVVEGANEITVEFIDGESYTATIKGTSPDNDLAVISVKLSDLSSDTLSQIKVATLGDSTKLKLGESAIAIGNALGYGQSVTVGYISATERTVQLSDKTMTLLQTDAAINPGNSGGALLNIKGEVIGINSAKYSDTSVEGTGYAIPISDALPIITDLMNSTYVPDEEKPYLGITGDSVPASYQERFDWPEGVYVSQITKGSPAELAGLQPSDIITAIDGTAVKSMTEIQDILSEHSVGDKITLSVTRSARGKTEQGELTATLIARKDAEK